MELEHEAEMLVPEVRELLRRERGHVDTVNRHRAGIGTVERADDLKQCGLAGTTWADDAHHLTFVDMQIDTFQYL